MSPKHLTFFAAALCVAALVWLVATPDEMPPDSGASSNLESAHSDRPWPVVRPIVALSEDSLHDEIGAEDAATDSTAQSVLPLRGRFPGRWKAINPANDVLVANALEHGKLRDRLLLQTIQAWASQAPDEARTWAEQKAEAGERDRLLSAIDDKLSGRDSLDRAGERTLEKVDRALAVFAWDKSQSLSVENETEAWARKNFEDAREWVLGQPPGATRDALIQRIAVVQVESDPTGAAQLISGEIASGSGWDEAALALVNRWARRDTAAATAWVNTFPDASLRKRAFSELQGLAAHR